MKHIEKPFSRFYPDDICTWEGNFDSTILRLYENRITKQTSAVFITSGFRCITKNLYNKIIRS